MRVIAYAHYAGEEGVRMGGEQGTERRKGRWNAYLEPYRQFMELIDSGQLAPGDQLPTYPEIEKRFDISHATATKVIRLLKENGYVCSSTQGVFVKWTKTDRLLQQLCDALNALEGDGQDPQLENSRDGSCIAVRSGAVCWNPHMGVWEKIAY